MFAKFIENHDSLCRLIKATFGAYRAFVRSMVSFQPKSPKIGWVPYAVRGEYRFIDRQKGAECLVVVLAGYKPTLWEEVFGRLRRQCPSEFDVCVVTSGRECDQLVDLCEKNGWSYLATKRNHVSLAQNLAIHLHCQAQWIHKIDEDIFLTDGYFSKLADVYCKAEQETRYGIAFAAPLIPVNGYGYVRILEMLNLIEEWERRFGPMYYTEGCYDHTDILRNPDAAKFMWGKDVESLRDIDALNSRFSISGPCYSICPIRFSIGAILFKRSTWIDWGMFPLVVGTGMGEDEQHICSYAQMHSKAIVVAENTVVGHLGFGPQTNAMLEYLGYNQDRNDQGHR